MRWLVTTWGRLLVPIGGVMMSMFLSAPEHVGVRSAICASCGDGVQFQEYEAQGRHQRLGVFRNAPNLSGRSCEEAIVSKRGRSIQFGRGIQDWKQIKAILNRNV